MSVMHQDGRKILLGRGGPDEFWSTIQKHYAHENPLTWKYLAMLALRENAGWPLEYICRVFDHDKGHITRCLHLIKRDIRTRFRPAPDHFALADTNPDLET